MICRVAVRVAFHSQIGYARSDADRQDRQSDPLHPHPSHSPARRSLIPPARSSSTASVTRPSLVRRPHSLLRKARWRSRRRCTRARFPFRSTPCGVLERANRSQGVRGGSGEGLTEASATPGGLLPGRSQASHRGLGAQERHPYKAEVRAGGV